MIPYGPHQRLTFGRKNISELEDLKETNFEGEKLIRLIHSAFPNLSISGILGEHCLVSQVYPTKDFDSKPSRDSLCFAQKNLKILTNLKKVLKLSVK